MDENPNSGLAMLIFGSRLRGSFFDKNLLCDNLIFNKQFIDISMGQVNLSHAHEKEYSQMLQQIIADGVCPFCVDFCEGKPPTYHPNPILIETDFWVATENVRKYEGVSCQLLLVAKKHVTHPWELSSDAWVDLRKILTTVVAKQNIFSGTFIMRFGDTNFTGGSVTHLHAQIVVGYPKEDGGKPLLVHCGYKQGKK